MADNEKTGYKTCNKGPNCIHPKGPSLPLEEFNKRSASPDGRTYTCKECEREQARQSYHRRKKKGKIKMTEEEHEMRKAYYREYYRENREKKREYDKKYRQSEEGKKKMDEGHKRRQERMKQQGQGKYERWEIIKRDSKDGVLYCGICGEAIQSIRDMQIDHIVPIAEGGSDTKDNVHCVHKECNLTRPKDGGDVKDG